MPTIDPAISWLVVIDIQARLVPVIEGADALIANVRKLRDAADLLGIPVLLTEQNPAGLGGTVPELAGGPTFPKMEFDVTQAEGFLGMMPERSDLILTGCEAHICVLQTAFGLLAAGRRVRVVRDAVGSRRAENKEAALERLAVEGADLVTTEMVIFEWLGSAGHPRFRDVSRLIK